MSVRPPDLRASEDLAATAVRPAERRRADWRLLSPMTTLAEMPALVVLSRLVAPVLLADAHGEILFVNPAFAALIGRDPADLQTVSLNEICHTSEAGFTAGGYSAWRGMVSLAHAGGWPIHASMTSDWFADGRHPVRLATFADMDGHVWDTRLHRIC
ncbi:hypothetical protein H7J81_00820 [Mycobacterium cookii]|nr:hypothetical protein [Mycobacterium cookii]MCV7328639.1 hypothetical protein [Mycobacterium cookii]